MPVDAGSMPSSDAAVASDDAGTKAGVNPWGPGGEAAIPSPWGLAARPANPTCVAPARPRPTELVLERAFPALSFDQPTGLYFSADGAYAYVLEQGSGRIRRFSATDDAREVEDVLRLSVRDPRVDGAVEVGLLGMAFDPAFERNGHIYVFYNPGDEPLRSVVERYTSRDGGRSFDRALCLSLLSILKPEPVHHGGSLAFSPRDGYLYVSVGDGNMYDVSCFAQDTAELPGKILRIDVRASYAQAPYAITSDNPYAQGGGRPEIWALGLRNPWRFSFDRETGELWVGDVGQDSFEEINLIERGKNYGWNSKEGFACTGNRSCLQSPAYPDRVLPTLPACDDPSLTDPVYAYGREEGVTVIGGFVYRGARLRGVVLIY